MEEWPKTFSKSWFRTSSKQKASASHNIPENENPSQINKFNIKMSNSIITNKIRFICLNAVPGKIKVIYER